MRTPLTRFAPDPASTKAFSHFAGSLNLTKYRFVPLLFLLCHYNDTRPALPQSSGMVVPLF